MKSSFGNKITVILRKDSIGGVFMKIVKALIPKFIMVTAVLWIVLGLFGVSLADILLTSVLLTGVSFIGDMFLLPRVKNIAVTIADFGLAFVLIWLVGTYFFEQPIRLGMATFISSIIIAAGEFVFHMYLQKQIFTDEKVVPEKNIRSYQKDNLQTEFGSEFDIKKPVEDKPKEKNFKHRPKKRKKKNPY
jgi:hypothetical protein